MGRDPVAGNPGDGKKRCLDFCVPGTSVSDDGSLVRHAGESAVAGNAGGVCAADPLHGPDGHGAGGKILISAAAECFTSASAPDGSQAKSPAGKPADRSAADPGSGGAVCAVPADAPGWIPGTEIRPGDGRFYPGAVSAGTAAGAGSGDGARYHGRNCQPCPLDNNRPEGFLTDPGDERHRGGNGAYVSAGDFL